MSYVEMEKRAVHSMPVNGGDEALPEGVSQRKNDDAQGRVVDIVLSDMSAPWDQIEGFWKRSKSNPYLRMMNTSGINTRDHGGSMVRPVAANTCQGIQKWLILKTSQDLCNAALRFTFDALRTGGHFVCKFYQGAEDKSLELRLKALFAKVHREKPESSRKVPLHLAFSRRHAD